MPKLSDADPRLFSHIVRKDRGFAPNPFWGYCTVACCKPAIRRIAQKEDWVVGLTTRPKGNKLLYAMRITEEPLSFEQYFEDKRFERKKPKWSSSDGKLKCGDNIYKPLPDGRYQQLASWHSDPDGGENSKRKKKDLRGQFVLVSNEYYYFGSKPLPLPRNLNGLVVGRGHRSNFSTKTIEELIRFVSKHSPGCNSLPGDLQEPSKKGSIPRRGLLKAGRSCK